MIVYYAVSTIYVLVCLILLLVILLQQGKGGDMASAFGGGSSQTAFGARAGATLLTKMTTVCAVLFMVGALVLAILAQRGPGSLVSGTPAPPPVQKPAAPAGTTPLPPSTPAPAPATPTQAPAGTPAAPQPSK
jgi:preprotein translocase subunit SecG